MKKKIKKRYDLMNVMLRIYVCVGLSERKMFVMEKRGNHGGRKGFNGF